MCDSFPISETSDFHEFDSIVELDASHLASVDLFLSDHETKEGCGADVAFLRARNLFEKCQIMGIGLNWNVEAMHP